MFARFAWGSMVLLASLWPALAQAQAAPAKVTIAVFGPPSLGSFLPPVIKANKLDAAHGLDITFVERPPDAYVTQFNSGEFQVGGSAAMSTWPTTMRERPASTCASRRARQPATAVVLNPISVAASAHPSIR